MADTLGDSKSKYRVAVASTDGETVNIHYGKSHLFYIYFVDDETGYDLVEKRAVTPVCPPSPRTNVVYSSTGR